ncbi:tyrosine phosphatase isoform [Strigomonas culicis]|uniref:Tyrosine phosphatase isoform n=1 Tax=Strigomonas culicis TaxID=28005 RepID=S9W4B3_9TRYP|nr:tyrosine phosphatase isoform [Strigomonas culicis]EPY34196.1 tyrosine phosphatase isoform [Strigomonas culicis]|eukprot:EPY30991.1 tyrosine phosphatase isoform [Strigomonas culicis]
MIFYAVDLALLFGYQQRSRLRIPPFAWRAAEPAILFLLFLCELISWIVWDGSERRSGAFVTFSLFCFALWVAHGPTRLEQFVFGLRVLCSADRRRYQADGFDLDLSYVHHNIIAMAWPADNFEKLFRNDVAEVADFLNRRHPQSYLVINLCSERTYNPTPFHHQTSWYPMDDHNPCELEMMVTFCRECSDFIGEDMYTRVLAIHCKGGKGRTGTLICALMMYMGIKRETGRALHHFARLRTKVGSTKFQGVQAPSQGRYVQYFEELIRLRHNNDVTLGGSPFGTGSTTNRDALQVPHAPVRITRLRVMNLPHVWYAMGIGKLYFVLLTKPNTERRRHYISNPDVRFSSKVPDPSSYTNKQLRDLFGADEDNLYKACNALDPNFSDENETGVGHHGYKLDNDSFWFYINNDWSRRLDYDGFHAAMRTHSTDASPTSSSASAAAAVADMNVSIEYKFPERIAALDGDVVLKFFYARNDPNPLEAPVQVWFHTAMEQRRQQGTHFAFSREDIDGPAKDKKFKRYPQNFSIEITVD